MSTQRHVRLFRNGVNQALRIPREFELPGTEAVLTQEGNRLILELIQPPPLVSVLAKLQPMDKQELSTLIKGSKVNALIGYE